VSEKLIKFRLDHPLRECMALAESLRDKFELSLCEVVPSDAGSGDTLNGIAVCAANHLETYLVAKTPTILAFSTGRTLRSMVEQIPSMHQPQHKIVSIVGNMS
jgi:DNA-binding transcriptional regulator LsrR (DeoR family)